MLFSEGPLAAILQVVMDTLAIPDLMAIFQGDWSPAQKLQEALSHYLINEVLMGDTTPARINQYAETVIDSLKETINHDYIPPV